MEELRELTEEAKAAGLAVVVWSYPRGPNLDKAAETALDICAYATQMAALMGANIIKVKPPSAVISLEAAKKTYDQAKLDTSTLAKRVEHVMQAAFAGKRVVVFSGGEAKDLDGVYEEVREHPRRRRQRQHHRPQHLPAAEGRRRWRCWARSSTSTWAKPERWRGWAAAGRAAAST